MENKDTEFEKDFLNFLNKLKINLSHIPIETQEVIINKLCKEWLPDYLKDIKKGYIYCNNCKKYFKKEEFKEITKVEKNIETTYSDAGYGDDDKYGEVEYLVYYQVCPNCKHETPVGKMYIRTLWERNYR